MHSRTSGSGADVGELELAGSTTRYALPDGFAGSSKAVGRRVRRFEATTSSTSTIEKKAANSKSTVNAHLERA